MEDDTLKRILQDKQFHLNIQAEQKEIIQNVLIRKDSMAECCQWASERACVTSPGLLVAVSCNYVKMTLYLDATSMQVFCMLFSSPRPRHHVLHSKLHSDISSAKAFFNFFYRVFCE